MSDEVAIDYVKNLKNDPSVILIDVREPSEVENGAIPGSINIPLADVEESFQMSDDEFLGKYGREKPNFETQIVFHCHRGRRGQMALNTAKKLGFVNAKNYPGGWAEWQQENKN